MDEQGCLAGVQLETERLRLRPFQEADLRDFYLYASEPGVGEMAGWPHHRSLDESFRIMDDFMSGGEVLALWHKEDLRVIGSIGLHRSWTREDPEYSHLRSLEIGYVLAKPYWGQSLMPEAVRRLLLYCFDVLKLDAVSCGHFTENNQSRRVIEKAGFRFVADGIFHSKQLKQSIAEKRYLLLLEDWTAMNSI